MIHVMELVPHQPGIFLLFTVRKHCKNEESGLTIWHVLRAFITHENGDIANYSYVLVPLSQGLRSVSPGKL